MDPQQRPLGPQPLDPRIEAWLQHQGLAPPPYRPRYGRAALLLAVTFVFTTTMGALWSEMEGIPVDEALWASPAAMARVWGDPALLMPGLAYSIPLLIILLCHELGHFLACLHYRLPATAPYFLPLPLGLGTLGAFIRIKAPIRLKHQLFDIGIAGPLAGFAALLPFLLYGFAASEPVLLDTEPEAGEPVVVLGMNLATWLAASLFHGQLPAGYGLELHPVALAAWVGLLATALNLIPLGQLDGGHILYAVAGRWQRTLALPLWILLAVAGLIWPAWWFWCLFVLITGLRHPPVQDEARPLDPTRRWLAALALAIFLLSFMPIPVGVAFAPG